MGYSKHKDRDPKETIEFIRSILRDAGLETDLRWTSRGVGSLCSNRVTFAGTNIGTNGKGTSEEYATASGYAEFMERLQHNILWEADHTGPEAYRRDGFLRAPDERYSTAEDVFGRHEPVLEGWLRALGVADPDGQLEVLRALPRTSLDRGDHSVCEVPFADPAGGRLVWLPAALVTRACGSNGMAAGNTYSECLVQGLSELFERHVTRMVLQGRAVPPRVPDAWLADAGLEGMVEQVTGGGRYEVVVHDASLGIGYPVAMTTIADRYRSTFGVKFGAHPSFSVAVERTLTEAFQGRNMDEASSTNHLAGSAEAADPKNVKWVFVNNLGAFPTRPFTAEPGWACEPWPAWEEGDNEGMLRHMLRLLERDGYRVLVRDSSHLGFVSCQVLVPGMSETFLPADGFLEGLLGEERASQAFSHFPQLTADEQKELIRHEPADIARNRPAVFARPFTGARMHLARVFGLLHFSRGEFAEARRCFLAIEGLSSGIGRVYWRAMALYAEQRSCGLDRASALSVVRFLNVPAVANRVEADVRAASEDLGLLFPQMSCYDCGRCQMLDAGLCKGTEAEGELYARVARAISESRVSQEALLDWLVGIMGDGSH